MIPDALNNAHSRLRMLGEAEGIKYSLKGKIGNTRDAHRLLYLRKTKSAEIEELLLSIIFRTHFEEDGDITSHEALIACGKEAGLDKAEVRNWLKNNGGGREVDRDNEEAGKQGITAVPHLRINDQYELRGTPDSQFLLQILTDK
ncbi:thioredoxin-like protein [Aspergillus alliaceus]|uniref:Thioredoxin-like protein n=1 Tax=Petromyces alliaceus TaxID=209559 RepID=A0A5N7CKW1_PETAA|nr:thioredoxin-like protein [Aspergillus alliaceus]